MIDNLVHLDDVTPESQDPGAGWSISQFRLPITRRHGSTSAVFHGRFLPGSTHALHRHDAADELCIYLQGYGLAGAGRDRVAVEPGHVRLMPKGVEHFFHSATKEGHSEVLGIYVGAGGVAESGYVFCGTPTDHDLWQCKQNPSAPRQYPIAHIADAVPHPWAAKVGWRSTDYRELLSTTNQPHAFAFAAAMAPGGFRARHQITNAETIYYVHSGEALAGADTQNAVLRPGHIWYIPPGQTSWINNPSATTPLTLFGYQVGVADTRTLGYEQLGADGGG